MEKIIIYGNGDFAKQIYWYFKSDTSFDVVAFCADKKYISDQEIYGLKVYEFETIEKNFKILKLINLKFLLLLGMEI